MHIPVSTLLETDHRAGFVEGDGQVSAEQVRFMLPTAGLRRLWVHADTGAPIKIDQTVQPTEADPGRARERLRSMLTPVVVIDRAEARHDPTARLAALIGVRDQECSEPGCSVAARRCDLDHEVRCPDGPTAAWNLAARSRRCHRAKHSGWTALRQPDGGTIWHSPLGRDYRRPGFWSAHPRVATTSGWLLRRCADTTTPTRSIQASSPSISSRRHRRSATCRTSWHRLRLGRVHRRRSETHRLGVRRSNTQPPVRRPGAAWR